MCFGSGGEQLVSSNKLDPKSQAFKDKTLDVADELGNRSFQTYGGQRIAGFTPDQSSAMNAVRSSMGRYTGSMGDATAAASGVASRRAPMIGGGGSVVPLDKLAGGQRGGNIGDGYTWGGDRGGPGGAPTAGSGAPPTMMRMGGDGDLRGLFDHLMQKGGDPTGGANSRTGGGDRIIDMMPGPDGVFAATQPTVSAYTADSSTVDPTNLERVGAGSLLDAPIDRYMNTYTQQALDPAIAEINRQAEIQKGGNRARATAAGAYGGSRAALMDAETNRNALSQIARTESEGMKSAFDTATNLVGQDQNRKLTADLTNAGATNAQLGKNMDALNQIAIFNAGQKQNAGQRTAELKQQTNLANQQADLSQQGLNLQGADLKGKLAKLGQDMNFQDIAALLGVGQQQQQQDQRNLDLGYQDFLNEQNYPLQMLNMRT